MKRSWEDAEEGPPPRPPPSLHTASWAFSFLNTYTTIHLIAGSWRPEAAGARGGPAVAVGTGAWAVLLAALGKEATIGVAEGRLPV